MLTGFNQYQVTCLNALKHFQANKTCLGKETLILLNTSFSRISARPFEDQKFFYVTLRPF